MESMETKGGAGGGFCEAGRRRAAQQGEARAARAAGGSASFYGARVRVLTPKFGKESNLWVQLGENSVRRKEGFFRCIRQKNPRSAICVRSARKLLS
jgi:hypothetical protein